MLPTKFQGVNAMISRKDFKDEDAHAIPCMQHFDSTGHACMVIAMAPSYEDRIAISEGRPVFIKIYATEIPPLHLFTTDEKGHENV